MNSLSESFMEYDAQEACPLYMRACPKGSGCSRYYRHAPLSDCSFGGGGSRAVGPWNWCTGEPFSRAACLSGMPAPSGKQISASGEGGELITHTGELIPGLDDEGIFWNQYCNCVEVCRTTGGGTSAPGYVTPPTMAVRQKLWFGRARVRQTIKSSVAGYGAVNSTRPAAAGR